MQAVFGLPIYALKDLRSQKVCINVGRFYTGLCNAFWSIQTASLRYGVDAPRGNAPGISSFRFACPNHDQPALFSHFQMPEFEECCRVRNLLIEKVDAHEHAEGVAIIYGLFNSFIRKIEPALQKIHSQHYFDAAWLASAFSGRIIWLNQGNPDRPGNKSIHSAKKFFSFGCSFTQTIFKIAHAGLFHIEFPSWRFYNKIALLAIIICPINQ